MANRKTKTQVNYTLRTNSFECCANCVNRIKRVCRWVEGQIELNHVCDLVELDEKIEVRHAVKPI